MSEKFTSSPNRESKPEPSREAYKGWYPTGEELQEYEVLCDALAASGLDKLIPTFEEHFKRPDPRIAIYERPADLPENAWYPTDEDLQAYKVLCEALAESGLGELIPTFEEHFKRPDPRVKRMVHPDEAAKLQSEATDEPT